MNWKLIFDAVRPMIGGSFTADQVKALDRACELAEGAMPATEIADAPPAPAPAAATPAAPRGQRLGAAGITLIKQYEGCADTDGNGGFRDYPDPGSDDGNPWTIGWGSTGADIRRGKVFTQQQCDDRFVVDMQRYAAAVSRAIGNAATTQNQFDALVSFHYNTGAIATATLTRLHVKGKYAEAKAQFARWVRNDDKVMGGLVRRRAAEAALYGSP